MSPTLVMGGRKVIITSPRNLFGGVTAWLRWGGRRGGQHVTLSGRRLTGRRVNRRQSNTQRDNDCPILEFFDVVGDPADKEGNGVLHKKCQGPSASNKSNRDSDLKKTWFSLFLHWQIAKYSARWRSRWIKNDALSRIKQRLVRETLKYLLDADS